MDKETLKSPSDICPNCKFVMDNVYQARYGRNILWCKRCGNAEGVPGF